MATLGHPFLATISEVYCTLYSGYSGHVYSGHSDIVAIFSWYKIHVFYYIKVRYSGQSDIVARKGWPKVATIPEVYCIKTLFGIPRLNVKG